MDVKTHLTKLIGHIEDHFFCLTYPPVEKKPALKSKDKFAPQGYTVNLPIKLPLAAKLCFDPEEVPPIFTSAKESNKEYANMDRDKREELRNKFKLKPNIALAMRFVYDFLTKFKKAHESDNLLDPL
jgi:hypothetical protein